MNNFGSAFDTFPSGITLPAQSEVLLKGVGQTTRIPLPACASPAHDHSSRRPMTLVMGGMRPRANRTKYINY